MKPSTQAVMTQLMQRIRDDALPALADSYAGQQLQRGLQLLQSVTDGLDDAASWRVAEIRALCRLFAAALTESIDQPALVASLTEAAAGADVFTPESLTLSALDRRLDCLRTALVALHTWSEASASSHARLMNHAIWQELSLSTERRKLSVGRF
jgi:hypothetical protein